MIGFFALPCLLALASAEASQIRPVAPVILSPQPGDTIGSTLTVSGTSSCSPVVVTLIPPGDSSAQELTIAADGSWTCTFNNVSSNVTVQACCKNMTPPNGPCASVSNLTYSATPSISELRAGPIRVKSLGIPEYPAGNIDLPGKFLYTPQLKQSVHVVLEPATLNNPQANRIPHNKVTLDTTNGNWTATFNNVGKGLYVVRAMLLSRGAPTVSTSWMIRVK
jgi:hypothetical protein